MSRHFARQSSRFFEIAFVFVRLDHIASIVINANTEWQHIGD
jgi:hypothetical protein